MAVITVFVIKAANEAHTNAFLFMVREELA